MRAAADEHLHVGRLGRLDGFAERGIVGRHVAPAEQRQLLGLDLVGDDALDDFAPGLFLRHEQRADRVVAGLRQREAELLGLAREEGVRNLHQDAGAVAGARIGADRAAMLEIAENADRVGDDLMRLLALDVGDEADAAGILLEAGIVEAFGGRPPACASREHVRGSAGLEAEAADSASVTMFSRSNSDPLISSPLNKAKGLTVVGAPWAFAAPTGPPLVLREPRFPKFRPGRSASPTNGLAFNLRASRRPTLRCNPRAGFAAEIETALLS